MSIRTTYDRWRRYRTTMRELGALTEAELTDLGIARSDIPRVAYDATRNAR